MLLNNFYEGTPVNIVNIDNVIHLCLKILETKKNWRIKKWKIWIEESTFIRNEEVYWFAELVYRT